MDFQLNIGLSLSASPFVVVILMIFCIGLGIWFYRNTNPAVSRGLRLLLTCIRCAALALVLLLVFTPVLRIETHSMRPPAVGLLIDNSSSMRLSDDGIPRSETVRQVLGSQEIARLSEKTIISDLPCFYGHNRLNPPEAGQLNDTLQRIITYCPKNQSKILVRLKEETC